MYKSISNRRIRSGFVSASFVAAALAAAMVSQNAAAMGSNHDTGVTSLNDGSIYDFQVVDHKGPISERSAPMHLENPVSGKERTEAVTPVEAEAASSEHGAIRQPWQK